MTSFVQCAGVGLPVGAYVGWEGDTVGEREGAPLGDAVGVADGVGVGRFVGAVGAFVGCTS